MLTGKEREKGFYFIYKTTFLEDGYVPCLLYMIVIPGIMEKWNIESTPKSNFLATKAQRHEEAPRLVSSFSLLCESLCIGVLMAFYYFNCFRSGLNIGVIDLFLSSLPVRSGGHHSNSFV